MSGRLLAMTGGAHERQRLHYLVRLAGVPRSKECPKRQSPTVRLRVCLNGIEPASVFEVNDLKTDSPCGPLVDHYSKLRPRTGRRAWRSQWGSMSLALSLGGAHADHDEMLWSWKQPRYAHSLGIGIALHIW